MAPWEKSASSPASVWWRSWGSPASAATTSSSRLDQAVQAQWSQVENVYQRRADLVPNLVETVKGAAKFEKDTFTAVTEARAKVGQVQGSTVAERSRGR